MKNIIIILAALMAASLAAQPLLAAAPVVSNIQVQQREGSPLVDISFDLSDDGNGLIQIIPMLSLDGGATWPVRCDSLSGDVYATPGSGRNIVWDARGNFELLEAENCRIRLFASDSPIKPLVEFFRLEGQEPVPLGMVARDTVGFGQPYGLMWVGTAPLLDGLDPQIVVQMDTIAPVDDGILGYKWRYLGDGCDPQLEDCWHPRIYDEATGDSLSFWGPASTLGFSNDGWGFGVFHQLLPSGSYHFEVDALDIAQSTVHPQGRGFELVVNYDPETILLNGETDPAHPEDPEVYPYYTLLNDPEQVHHPFVAGERIPDRSYVVFKGLFRDDARDAVLNESYVMRGTGSFSGMRENLGGGFFSFESPSSSIVQPATWPAGLDGWAADTLGFMVGPRTDYTFRMQAVDEHGRRDGTPATLEFSVGYPPCVQGVELLAGSMAASAFGPDLECYDGQPGHPLFGAPVPEFQIRCEGYQPQPGEEFLAPEGLIYLGIHKQTMEIVQSDESLDSSVYYVFPCMEYPVSILVHGQDDPREAWSDPLNRLLALRYQVDHACDPENQILEGPGDDISMVTWGEEFAGDDLQIDPETGLWRIKMKVALPQNLIQTGMATFRLIVQYQMAQGDGDLADAIIARILAPLGDGTVRVVALDQTRCEAYPVRPARYHIFSDVRPPGALPPGHTWRDCSPYYYPHDSLGLEHAAMESQEVERAFRIQLVDVDGSVVSCEP